jgi:glycosyltransferase involved in cell wall biosynthesis/predicted metal-dependent phosphoesterase TrpH
MTETSRADLHVHSSASSISKLGVQRSLMIPECATDPAEVYELAKRRSMDFVTLTDHDAIAGALSLAHLPDTFISEELTASFKGEPQAVHILCYGITPDDHEWLQKHRTDVEECAEYLHAREITAALAHPFFAVAAPLTARHRRRLAELFPIWETRNGSRAKELNLPAFVYIETHGGTAIGGSDDHAGIDIGRTFTETPHARTAQEFLTHIRAGRAAAHGAQGSAAKWAHAAMALAIRSLGVGGLAPASGPTAVVAWDLDEAGFRTESGSTAVVARNVDGAGFRELSVRGAVRARPDGDRAEPAARPAPHAVLKIVERVLREGDARHGAGNADLGAEDALALLRAWLAAMDLDVDEHKLLTKLQEGELSHGDLDRRARRVHERKLAAVVRETVAGCERGNPDLAAVVRETVAGCERGDPDLAAGALSLFDACIPAIPYAAASAFLGREKARLTRSDGDRPRVALVADGIGGMHGVTHTLQQIRAHGVRGFDVEVIGTDCDVDRRLSAVAEIDVPFYPGLKIGVPTVPAIVDALAEGRYDIVHVCSPGPAGVGAWLLGRLLELPVVGSYHTELAAYAALRTGRPELEALVNSGLRMFYGACDVVLSPSPAADSRLAALGIQPEVIRRWDRGVDLGRFDPAHRDEELLPGEVNVLYAGRLSKEKGVDLLADAFLEANRRDPRLHLVLAGGGPEEDPLRARLGEQATFLGWLSGDALARAYASADLFLFASSTETFGQVVLEAQASGLPVVAVDRGGPACLIEQGETGLLAPPDVSALADAVLSVTQSPRLAERTSRGGLAAVTGRSWEAALDLLATAYRIALDAHADQRLVRGVA